MPIKDLSGNVIGVAQVLLDLARIIFEEQSTIEHMVYRILTHTQSLIQCQRLQVLLVHRASKGSFSRVFDLEASDLNTEELDSQIRYEKAVIAMAKQSVTLEVLSYHASASLQDARRVKNMLIPSAQSLMLHDFKFDDIHFTDDDTLKACLRMFLDLDFIERFHIDYEVLCRWLLSVKKNYRNVTYHNWRHAFNVAQMMFSIITATQWWKIFGEIECLGLMIACLCHDLDHRGTNNSFQIKKRGAFFNLVRSDSYNWLWEDHRELLRAMTMTVCDLAAITKPWEVERRVAELVSSEFFEQGDIEREELNITPIDMMNREKEDQLPLMQVGFIDSICLPVYEVFALLSDKLSPLEERVRQNKDHWLELAASRAKSRQQEGKKMTDIDVPGV
ncbi:hypothetical protein J437_LFUL018571 [Ladona fulva]|uniref:PDEase domain-containing protein n=1 Tax=Ladona fulva TaxID=123851 RepID=A0A8K0PCP7_LADFU|nr:hypothetical protein J437_LFUL018571 [Ladona fulva]